MTGPEKLGVLALAVGTFGALALVPRAAWSGLGVPETHAIYGYLSVLPLLAWLRRTHRLRAERACVAVFLTSMPLVYVGAALRTGAPPWVELAGFALFLVIAAAGALRWHWLLAAGVAAHGLAWDLWHAHGLVVQPWYAPACAVIDLALGAYVATRVPAWRATAAASCRPASTTTV